MNLWRENRGQTSIELAVAVALAIFIATVAGIIAKQALFSTGGNAQQLTNNVVQKTS